jgi:hypothetical protein
MRKSSEKAMRKIVKNTESGKNNGRDR